MFQQVKLEIPVLTPDLVRWFHGLPHLRGDRDLVSPQGQRRIEWLGRLCQSGEFYSPDWAVAVLNNKEYRINGGHSSAMLSQAGGFFPRNLPVILRWFSCESRQDVVELFNHFDNRKSSRTPGDKAKVHKSVHRELDALAPTSINRLLNGIQCFYADGVVTKGDEDERTKLIHAETEFLAWAGKFVRVRFMARSGLIACLYRSFHASPSLAEEFWSMVLTESAPSPSHATRVLAKFLRELDYPANRGRWDSRAIYVKSIHAWNAWQLGTSTDLKYYPGSSIPDLIIVTNGKNRAF